LHCTYNTISQCLFVDQALAHHNKAPLRATHLPHRNYETAVGLRHLPQYSWLVEYVTALEVSENQNDDLVSFYDQCSSTTKG
jgi:hypothetical protein